VIALAVLALAGADCAGCHPDEAAAFAGSRHAVADRLAIYRASAAVAQTRWCAGCHQPAGPRAAGLACLTCHRAGHDAVRGARAPSAAALAAHPVVIDADDGCHGCHEFRTPLPDHLDPVVYSSAPLQATASELAASDPRARCGGCHDPHRALGGHDPATVRGALTFTATSVADGVVVRITARGVGHHLPSGDPFRRIVVELCADASCAEVRGRRQLGRGFAMVPPGVWAPVLDQTLADGETRVLRLPAGGWWRAELRYGDPRFEARLPEGEVALELDHGPT
jgi:hypothetical protein